MHVNKLIHLMFRGDLVKWIFLSDIYNLFHYLTSDISVTQQGDDRVIIASPTTAGEVVQSPMGQIKHVMWSSLPVTAPILIFHHLRIIRRYVRMRSNWNTTRTEKRRSDIQPLDGLVADDDG